MKIRLLFGLFSLEFGFYYSTPGYCGVGICLTSQRRNLSLHAILAAAARCPWSTQIVLVEPTKSRQTRNPCLSKLSDEKVIKNTRLIYLEDRFQWVYSIREWHPFTFRGGGGGVHLNWLTSEWGLWVLHRGFLKEAVMKPHFHTWRSRCLWG